ncbi:cyclin-D5-1-like [Senna tora]|uniref:Cyclin-D5-1-like n=1 Tax=Senna tora TaxID=362788 RepID=A0A834W5B5_9FABA|nr:cyclin-D5-1-like [Senna tora]
MEEQNVPPLSDFPAEDYCFENKVIRKMELLILDSLEWKMGSVTPFAYLHYFFNKFCVESNSHVIVSTAAQHIMAFVKEVNLIDYRPSVIASASILAAFDATLTRTAMDLRLSVISSWGSIESEIERRKSKTPDTNSTSSTVVVLENPSLISSGAKRKLTFVNNFRVFTVQCIGVGARKVETKHKLKLKELKAKSIMMKLEIWREDIHGSLVSEYDHLLHMPLWET